MLRVGLTGELGSGKSTVARLLAARGATVLSSDDMARAMMQPGEPVYRAIVDRFGSEILLPDGAIDRRELARVAFDPHRPRIDQLNAIVHPAVLAEQERRVAALAAADPYALVVIESALLFTTRYAGDDPWQTRFDRIILVTAPEEVKITRFLERAAGGRPLTPSDYAALQADARARLAAQRISPELATGCLVIRNTGTLEALEHRTEEVFQGLLRLADTVER